jgi:hypothetical protein
MKQRKSDIKKYTYNEILKIADKANSENSLYKLFEHKIYNEIYSAAEKGNYYVNIDIAGYDDKFIKKIDKELMKLGFKTSRVSSNDYGNVLHGIYIMTVNWERKKTKAEQELEFMKQRQPLKYDYKMYGVYDEDDEIPRISQYRIGRPF